MLVYVYDEEAKQEAGTKNNNKKRNILKLVYDYHAWQDVTIHYVDGLNANNNMGLLFVMGHTLIMSYPPILTKQEEEEQKRIRKEQQQQQQVKKQQQQQQHNNILDNEEEDEYGGNDDDYITNRKAYHVHFVLAITVEDGTILWSTVTGMEDYHSNNKNLNKDTNSFNNSGDKGIGLFLLGDPLTDTILSRGAQSVARRRSRIPGLSDVPTRGGDTMFKVIDSGPELSYHHHHGHDMNHNEYRRTNCLRDYRYSLLTSSSTSWADEEIDGQDHVLPHIVRIMR